MTIIDITFQELNAIKQEIELFSETNIKDYEISVGNDMRYLLKKVVFFKYIKQNYHTNYGVNSILSDYIFLIDSIINSNVRYYNLNIRSIIEHSLRIFNEISTTSTMTYTELMDNTKEKIALIDDNDINLGLISQIYNESCNFVHGNINAEMPLAEYFSDCFSLNNNFPNLKKNVQHCRLLTDELLKLFLYSHYIIIDSSFHRRKTILKYLINPKYVTLLKELTD